MVEINLGNKTLLFGVAIALILAYGMVNFNSVQRAEFAFPKAEAVSHPAPVTPAQAPVAEPAGSTHEEAALASAEEAMTPSSAVEPAASAAAPSSGSQRRHRLDAVHDASLSANEQRILEMERRGL